MNHRSGQAGKSPPPSPTTQPILTRKKNSTSVNDIMPIFTVPAATPAHVTPRPPGKTDSSSSVFAYDPKSDYRMIVKDSRDRRSSPPLPRTGLFLKKPTMTIEHGGGLRLRKIPTPITCSQNGSSRESLASPGDATLTAIEVTPKSALPQAVQAGR